jgi:oligopeptide/dipeptide ABC transporter ATP-binding protein
MRPRGGDLLHVADLVKHFPTSRSRSVIVAADHVSFHIAPGETLALVGESGSGKSTVGRCILRLVEPTSGTIRFHGQDITKLRRREFRQLRPNLQMVFQEPYLSLNPRMRAGQAIFEPLRISAKVPSQARAARVLDVAQMVGLSSDVLERYPAHLTQGEQQKVAIARAIATEPEFIVLDEVTSALDISVRTEITDLLIKLQQELGVAYLLISHDLSTVRRIAHRVAVMYLGRIVEVGSVEDIFTAALHPYTRALLASTLEVDPAEVERWKLGGEIPSSIDLPRGCYLYSRCPLRDAVCADHYPPLVEVRPGHWSACFMVHKIDPTVRVPQPAVTESSAVGGGSEK